MTATTAPAAAKPADKKVAEDKPATPPKADGKQQKLGLTVGRLRVIENKLQRLNVLRDEAATAVADLMYGREDRSSEKVDALRSIGSLVEQLKQPHDRVLGDTEKLIELVLDDD